MSWTTKLLQYLKAHTLLQSKRLLLRQCILLQKNLLYVEILVLPTDHLSAEQVAILKAPLQADTHKPHQNSHPINLQPLALTLYLTATRSQCQRLQIQSQFILSQQPQLHPAQLKVVRYFDN